MAVSTEQFAMPARARFAQRHPLISFFVLTYVWSWCIWVLVPNLLDYLGPKYHTDPVYITIFLSGIFGPTVAALMAQWLAYRDFRICTVWTGWRSFLLGLGVGLASFFAVTVAAPSFALVKAPWTALHWSALAHWSTYGINYSTFLGGPVSEEPGWRGFALPKLQRRFGPFWATLILAPLWAGWHLPLFQMPGWSSASPWQFLLILIGVSFLITAATNLAKFGLVVPIVLHAFFNTSSAMGNSLNQNLPIRNHEMLIYTFVVLICGTGLGLTILTVQGNPWKKTSSV
jgi:membrane protease YdiL (CAAX protease family)